MSQPTLPRLLLLLLLLHLLIIPSAISARPLTQHKSTPSSLKDESPISIDGLCGSHTTNNSNSNNQKTTCLHSPFGDSCSKWGFCGSFYEKEYSGRGCQADFGVCNSEFATATNDAAESSTTLSTSSSFSTSTTTSTPGIIIIPITTTFVSVVVSTSGSFTPVQTLTGMVGFCGVAGSNCKM